MGHETARLSALQVAKLKKAGYYCDGAGLYLQVSKTGSKSWIFRYTLNGKSKEMGLGSFTSFTLAEARKRATENRQLLVDGIDPLSFKQRTIRNQRISEQNVITFDKAAERFIESNSAQWRNPKHTDQWRNTLSTYASPIIGSLPVSEVTTPLVLRILQPIWNEKTETATRLRGRIEKILNWARAQGFRTGDNPATWRGHLSEALPNPSKVAKKRNYAALPWPEMGSFMRDIRIMEGSAALAVELVILTATRTNEVFNAAWSEFDLATGVWTIPKERMKMFREHRVPLSPAALAVLEKAKKGSKDSSFVFPGRKKGSLSNMAGLQLLKRMERTDLTIHGMRSTFRDWCAEATSFPKDVVEMSLAHAIENKTEAAYRRGDLLEKRRVLINEWADYCNKIAVVATVSHIRATVTDTGANG